MATTTYGWIFVTDADFLNTGTLGTQHSPAIASNAAGTRYFGTWDEPGSDLVLGRIVGSGGAPLTGAFQVNSTATDDQFGSSIAGLANGSFVVTFTDFSAGPAGDVRFRMFDGSGSALGPDALVAPTNGSAARSDVAALADGRFVVAFDHDFADDLDILARLFNTDGSPSTDVIFVASSFLQNAIAPSISALASGGFVVAWQESPAGGGTTEARFRRYDSTGTPQGAAVLIDSSGFGLQVQGLGDGGFVVAYADLGWGLSSTEITAQVFNADGSARSSPILVNAFTTGEQSRAALTLLSNGFFVVSWTDVASGSLLHQAYDANGNAAGGNFVVATSTVEAEIAALTGGLVANVRRSTLSDGSGDSIRHDISELTRTTDGDATGETLTGDSLRDTITGNGGDDVIDGGANVDQMDGGDGIDTVSWASRSAGVFVNLVNQTLNSGAAAGETVLNFEIFALTNRGDVFFADNSGVTIRGLDGFDLITGGTGNDAIDGGDNGDAMDGAAGTDTVSWASATAGATVNLIDQALSAGAAAGDTAANFEIFALTNFADTFVGGAEGITVNGLGGADALTGGAGNDLLDGGADDDSTFHGGNVGDYAFAFLPGNDLRLVDRRSGAPEGVDTLRAIEHAAFANATLAILFGTPADDSFIASGSQAIGAGVGNDSITFDFRLVDATITYGANSVLIESGSTLTVVSGFDRFVFTDGTVDNNDGSPLVDDLFYYSQNHDVWNAHVDADAHYNAHGWREGRDPNAFFDTSIYLSAYPDVAAAGTNPLSHFDTIGWKEARVPSLAFDPRQYLAANPDVAAANIDPLWHFLAFGASEGREPFDAAKLIATNGFDYVYYLATNPDVKAAGVDPLQHFQTTGWTEGRNPNALFDTAGYLATYTDVAAAHINPLDHYNVAGWREGRDPSVNFDTTSYLSAYGDVAAANVNPLMHFLYTGQDEGRSAFADGAWG
jgi:hypothetical protein